VVQELKVSWVELVLYLEEQENLSSYKLGNL
jgi:hypothetical protein